MAGPELGGLGCAVVRLLAAARSGNDAASVVQRRAYGHNRDRHGLDSGLPPSHRGLDALMRCERTREGSGSISNDLGIVTVEEELQAYLVHLVQLGE